MADFLILEAVPADIRSTGFRYLRNPLTCSYTTSATSVWYIEECARLVSSRSTSGSLAPIQAAPILTGNSSVDQASAVEWARAHYDPYDAMGLMGYNRVHIDKGVTLVWEHSVVKKTPETKKSFEARVRQGHMVLKPYINSRTTVHDTLVPDGGTVHRVRLPYVGSAEPSSFKTCSTHEYGLWPEGAASTMWPALSQSLGGTPRGGFNLWLKVIRNADWKRLSDTDPLVPEIGRVITAQLAAVRPSISLGTTCVARNNQSVYDLLTDIGEALKDTIRQALSGLNRVYQMSVEALAAVKRLLNGVRPSRLASKLIKGNLRTSELRKLKRKLPPDDPLSAAADVWLTYRYGIRPIMISVENLLNYLEGVSAYKSTRTMEVVDVEIRVGDWTGTLPIVQRCFGKARVDPTHATAGLGLNLMATAWELIPFSFVVDWFLRVGQFLLTLCTPQGLIQQVWSYSNQYIGTAVLTNQSGRMVAVDVSHYSYTPVAKLPTGVVWAPALNKDRWTDTFAFTTKKLLDAFRKLG